MNFVNDFSDDKLKSHYGKDHLIKILFSPSKNLVNIIVVNSSIYAQVQFNLYISNT